MFLSFAIKTQLKAYKAPDFYYRFFLYMEAIYVYEYVEFVEYVYVMVSTCQGGSRCSALLPHLALLCSQISQLVTFRFSVLSVCW